MEKGPQAGDAAILQIFISCGTVAAPSFFSFLFSCGIVVCWWSLADMS